MSMTTRELELPAQYALRGKVRKNPVKQILLPSKISTFTISERSRGRTVDYLLENGAGTPVVITARRARAPAAEQVLFAPDLSPLTGSHGGMLDGVWLNPRAEPSATLTLDVAEERCEAVLSSWRGQFTFREERHGPDGATEGGLRPPQVGALYAVLAHWKVSSSPATVVMPTGTGKTETMLALMAWERLPRLLVVVPTNPLREQIGLKFLTMGLLRQLGVLGADTLNPIVGLLQHKPRDPDEVDEIFRRCNVVVTTMAVAGQCSLAVQRRMAELCTHLFIDEAHHISARTWDDFREQFLGKPIVQFTATPFRNDGKHVDGRIVFNYPLRKAQAEGYFKPIQFVPVDEINKQEADLAIARAAVDRLQQDLDAGFSHLVMARANSIARAKTVHEVYCASAPQLTPVLVHNGVGVSERREALRRLRANESRIVVCVDMLGEGFDLPELKVAALHDHHKSLAITLQFTGRFTRTRSDLGDATVIANIADPGVNDALRELYAEDADWNVLLRDLSEGATGRQARRSEFLDAFANVPEEVALRTIFPKMSTVVYRTQISAWRPDRAASGMGSTHIYAGPTVNEKDKVLLFITRESEPVPWGDVRHLSNTEWHLYIVHWDEERRLLFINSSNHSSTHEELAKAIGGSDALLIRGEVIFRCLDGINRLVLTNLGLSHLINLRQRFSMHVGPDISDALPEAQRTNKKKSNLFGSGFENGSRATIGCSQKGRIWSFRVASDISEWVEWCHHVGSKLIDQNISTAAVFDRVILPKPIEERPELVPLTIEWPDRFLERTEDAIHVEIDGVSAPFFDAGLEIVDFSRDGPIRFRVVIPGKAAEYTVVFREESVEYRATGSVEAEITIGRKRRTLSEWFRQEAPVIRFENGAYLEHNELYELPAISQRQPFDRARIDAWDWSGVDLKKESQKVAKRADSIQRRVIEHLLDEGFDPYFEIIFDDDDAGEAADIVCVRVLGNRVLVHLYHCKFSTAKTAGARIEDLYAVCGQAQRSVYWKAGVEELLRHLRRRDDARRGKADERGAAFVSRFERGNPQALHEIVRKAPLLTPEFKIFVVQPGRDEQGH